VTVTKGPCEVTLRSRQVRFYSAAREGLAALLEAQLGAGRRTVLLPAYVGWSPREGSGIFDPVRASGIAYDFYAVGADLAPQVRSLAARIERAHRPVVLLVHYFGRRVPGTDAIRELTRSADGFLIEDWAHGFLSEDSIPTLVGDAAIYSLHKMLPVPDGGAVVVPAGDLDLTSTRGELGQALLEFDLATIRERRRRNFIRTGEELRALSADVDGVAPLWESTGVEATPQSFPVLVPASVKDELYHRLNDRGVGVTSPYHTLVPEILEEQFPVSHDVSRRILNLPVHQDVDVEDVPRIVTALREELLRAAHG
jgi:dTDP-4-amino-4,6-dideoxygalactose transaminase